MAKQLQTSIVINGKASPSLQKAFQTAQNHAEKTSKAMSGIGSVAKKVGGILTAAFTVNKIAQFAKDAEAGYNDIIQSETKLSTIMKQRMNASDSQISQIIALADAQEKLGVVDAESQKYGAQQLATFLNSSESLKTLIPAMNDLAVQQNGVNVTSENMVSIGNLIGKVMQGQVGALSKVGITFSKAQEEVLKYGNEQQKAAILSQVITDNVGKMNEAIADTPEGKEKRFANLMGQVSDEVGKAVVNFKSRFIPTLEKLVPVITDVACKIGPVFDKIGDGIQWCIDNSGQLTSAFRLIVGVVASVTAALIAYNAVIKIQMIITAIAKGYKLLSAAIIMYQNGAKLATIAQTLLNGAMSLNPIGLIIAAIVALVAGFAYLWTTSETFRNFWIGIWSKITGAVMGALNWIKQNWQLVLGFILNPFAGIFTALYKYNENFRSWVNGVVEIIKGPINWLINLINTKFIATLNKLKIPDWVPGVGGKGFHLPEIPQFGTGGTLTRPQVAVVGDKPETIVPHGNTPRNRSLLKEAAAGVGASSSTGNVYNYFTFAPTVSSGGNISKQLSDEEEKFERKMDAYFAKKGRLAFNG